MITQVPTTLAVDQLRFDAGLPGFPGARSFRADPWGGDGSDIIILTAIGMQRFQFVVVPPKVFFPDYTPEFSGEHLSAVGLSEPGDGAVYVILTLGATADAATANLLGPLLVNPADGRAVQAVQQAGSWDTRAPIVSPAS